MDYYCNPVNFGYKYQFNRQRDGNISVSREGADPSMILFKSRYYIFPSMTGGFIYSDDMIDWQFHSLKNIPIYDYAPDVRVAGDYVYFCASTSEKGVFYRTTDLFSDSFEKIDGAFPFWDPNLLVDDDGRMFFYWGSSTSEPLYGIELNPADMSPIGERQELVWINDKENGYERSGENHVPSRTPEEIAADLKQLEASGMPESAMGPARAYIMCLPYIEGVWVNKHGGRYYLQYAAPSSECNTYADGVYISKNPLGPYTLAANNPYSYKPGGFIPGAGHGSTMEDRDGNAWHTSTMRICVNHNFERRIGIWPAGWDDDGELFCNQRYGDWPQNVKVLKNNPWANPDWMLLSYGKSVNASSGVDGKGPENIVDENVRTWWRADTNASGEWVEVDLGQTYKVHAIQINFADDDLHLPMPEQATLSGVLHQERWIDEVPQATRWILEGSVDGADYFVIEDKSQASTDLPHDLVVQDKGIMVQYVRLTIKALPYEQAACVSGLRVFGLGDGSLPLDVSEVDVKRAGDLDIDLSWAGDDLGYVVNWGYHPNKLYHSYQVFGTSVRIGGLVKNQKVYLRVDSFNENGITEGSVIKV